MGVAAALLVIAVTGCSAGDTNDPADSKPNGGSGVVAVGRCLQDRGWEISVSAADDSISFRGTSDQVTAYDADYEECEAEFGEEVTDLAEFTDEMWRDLYHQEEAVADCLRGKGVDVPPIPSYQTFVERYMSDEPWTSYSHVPAISADQEQELNEACPQPDL